MVGGEDPRLHEMHQQIERYQDRADCSVMGAEIGEEAGSSAHHSAGAVFTPASHNSRLPWRQKCLNVCSHKQTL